eukprot:1421435-Amphidinium_carterae.1
MQQGEGSTQEKPSKAAKGATGDAEVKALDCPSVKVSMQEMQRISEESALEPAECTKYRSGVMRIAYLSLDRLDLGHAVKCLSRHMQKPTASDIADLKRVGSHGHRGYRLCGRPDFEEEHYWSGDFPWRSLHQNGDRTQSNLQSTVSLSSGEAEYYGIVKAKAMGCMMKSLLADFGIEVVRGAMQEGVQVFSDSSAARAFAQRKDWDDKNTSTSDGCGCKTRCFRRKRQWKP